MNELNLKDTIIICLIGCTLFGVIFGFTIGMYLQKEYDDIIVNQSAQSNYVLKSGNYYYTVTNYVPPCKTLECLTNLTILTNKSGD